MSTTSSSKTRTPAENITRTINLLRREGAKDVGGFGFDQGHWWYRWNEVRKPSPFHKKVYSKSRTVMCIGGFAIAADDRAGPAHIGGWDGNSHSEKPNHDGWCATGRRFQFEATRLLGLSYMAAGALFFDERISCHEEAACILERILARHIAQGQDEQITRKMVVSSIEEVIGGCNGGEQSHDIHE